MKARWSYMVSTVPYITHPLPKNEVGYVTHPLPTKRGWLEGRGRYYDTTPLAVR